MEWCNIVFKSPEDQQPEVYAIQTTGRIKPPYYAISHTGTWDAFTAHGLAGLQANTMQFDSEHELELEFRHAITYYLGRGYQAIQIWGDASMKALANEERWTYRANASKPNTQPRPTAKDRARSLEF